MAELFIDFSLEIRVMRGIDKSVVIYFIWVQ